MHTGPDDTNKQDPLAIALALLAALHCLMADFLPTGLGSETAHAVVAAAAVLASLIAMVSGGLVHGDGRIWFWGGFGWLLFGFARIGTGRGSEVSEVAFTVLASGLTAFAHLLNRSLRYWHKRL